MKTNAFKDKLLVCAILAAILILFVMFSFPCPIRALLHFPCPGCGMTRAYLSLLRFDIAEAFRMHGMFWSMPILLVYFFADWKPIRNKIINDCILIVIGIGFLVNWIFKLAA